MVEDDARCEEQDRPTSANLYLLDMHGADDNPKDDEVEDEWATNTNTYSWVVSCVPDAYSRVGTGRVDPHTGNEWYFCLELNFILVDKV